MPATPPFDGPGRRPAELRRACEVQAKGHLSTCARAGSKRRATSDRLGVLVDAVGRAAAALLSNVARLERPVAPDDGTRPLAGAGCAGSPHALIRRCWRSTTTPTLRRAHSSGGCPDYLAAVGTALGASSTAWHDDRGPTRARGRASSRRWRCCAIVALAGRRGRRPRRRPLPALTQPVNDFAHVIDPPAPRESTGASARCRPPPATSVVVATVRHFAPYGDHPRVRRQAVRDAPGIGDAGKDNGLLIVLALDERRVRIEVGYGLEEFITDGFAGDTSRQVMLPAFRDGDYGEGLLAGTTRVIQRIAERRGVTLTGVPRRTAAPRGDDVVDPAASCCSSSSCSS